MIRRTAAVALCGVLWTAGPIAEQRPPDDVGSALQRQTQELMDAVATGDRGPSTRYLDDRMVYSAEDGATKSTSELLAELRPLPKEIWAACT